MLSKTVCCHRTNLCHFLLSIFEISITSHSLNNPCQVYKLKSNISFSGLNNTIFYAELRADDISMQGNQIIRWDNVHFDPGNNYDRATGAYTVRYDGFYQCSATLQTVKESPLANLHLLINTIKTYYCWTGRFVALDSAQTSCTVTLKLNAGQTVQIENAASSVVRGHYFSWFTCHMVAQ